MMDILNQNITPLQAENADRSGDISETIASGVAAAGFFDSVSDTLLNAGKKALAGAISGVMNG